MPPITIQPLAQSLIEAQKIVLSHLNDLDRARLEAINRIQLHKTSLQNNSTRYSETFTRFQGMREADSQNISTRIEKIDQELARIVSTIKEIRLKLNTLPHKRTIYDTTKTKLEDKNGEKERLIKEFGTPEEIAKKIEQGEKELETILGELNKLSGQQRLITLAIQYLETSRAKECPVCSQSINYEVIIKDLKTKVSKEITKTIMHLQEDEKGTKSHRKALDEASETQKNLSREISELEISLSKAGEELRRLVPDFEKLSLDEVNKSWEQEISGLSGKESELRTEQNELRETLKQFVELKTTLERLEKELQKETSSQLTGTELTKKVEEKIKALDGEVTKYSDSEAVDTLRRNLSNLADILTYLRDEDQVQTIEREMPTVEKQIQDLEARKISLQSLAASLQTLRQIATQYEKEAALTQLRRLEDEINNYYNRILGHPHFTRLKVDIEKEDPLIFSFRAASDQDDTYIPTRFSTAQLNAAALSIFMSNSSQQAGDLPIMILDDPTQNMDTAHKEAFAKVVATLPPRHQVIVATEDDETRRFLEKHCKEMETYELRNWTTDGPEIRTTLNEDRP
jgi:DNA repair exonuclease SbcCD ATPase subunit